MFFKNAFKKPEPEVILTPMERACKAVDELNAAVADFGPDERHIRPYVASGDARFHRRRRHRVMLGHWAPNYVSNGQFIVVYGDDSDG